MLFNSFQFLVFFPAVLLVYFLVPAKWRYLWLLAASYYFYMCWNASYALLMLTSTAVTYLSGIGIQAVQRRGKSEERIQKWKKGFVAGSFAINLAILFFFKYFNFVVDTINRALEMMHLKILSPGLDVLLPVGISFYIFQALSYTMDVYRGSIHAERNFLRYALFVSFFPQLVAGPIERSKNLLSQIENLPRFRLWNFERVKSGLLLMLWGYFLKLVISDRTAIAVNAVFDHYEEYGPVELAVGAVLFSFQIYCDFNGYSTIAKGAAQVMGFTLMDNFRQPYLAQDIRDFWRRWHISLTSWFTDYLYIPLGGNRKGLARQCVNIMIVFLTSGLWHGAAWTYVFWGVLHGGFQVIGNLRRKWSIRKNQQRKSWRKLLAGITTFLLVTFSWILFRAESVSQAKGYLLRMFEGPGTLSFPDMGLSQADWVVLALAGVVLFVVDLLHEHGIRIRQTVERRPLGVRWFLYASAVWSIILFGIYGSGYDASQFIYFQF